MYHLEGSSSPSIGSGPWVVTSSHLSFPSHDGGQMSKALVEVRILNWRTRSYCTPIAWPWESHFHVFECRLIEPLIEWFSDAVIWSITLSQEPPLAFEFCDFQVTLNWQNAAYSILSRRSKLQNSHQSTPHLFKYYMSSTVHCFGNLK